MFRESWQEWEEDNIDVEQMRAVCLFCEKTEGRAAPLLEHMKVSLRCLHHRIVSDIKI